MALDAHSGWKRNNDSKISAKLSVCKGKNDVRRNKSNIQQNSKPGSARQEDVERRENDQTVSSKIRSPFGLVV